MDSTVGKSVNAQDLIAQIEKRGEIDQLKEQLADYEKTLGAIVVKNSRSENSSIQGDGLAARAVLLKHGVVCNAR
jgi:hypothetical protein